MARDISLTSQEWCDLIFEGKNKTYGAYTLRQTSSRRHVTSLVIVALMGTSVLFCQQFLRGEASSQDKVIEIGPTTLSEFDEKTEPIIPPQENIPPPPQEMAKSIIFVPPTVVDDNNATGELPPQDQLTDEKDAIISTISNPDGIVGGINPADIPDITGAGGEGTAKPETIFEHVESPPQYPGGDKELLKYLKDNIKYPMVDQEIGTQGVVSLKFVVGKDGSVTDVQIVRSLSAGCDKEAIRVVKTMPKWIPGKQNGRPVMVYFNLPVRFRLSGQ